MKNHSKMMEGFTLIEMLVVMAVITVLAALLLPAIGSATHGATNSSLVTDSNSLDQVATHEEAVATYQPCLNNLKQVSRALKLWAVDHNGKFPFNVSTNEGGTMELCSREIGQFDQSTFLIFKQMSNELVIPKILVCPADWLAKPADGFQSLERTNVSYLLRTGSNINSDHPEQILAFCPIHEHMIYADGRVVQGPQPGPLYRLPSTSQLRAGQSSQAEISSRKACILNLRTISGAKAQWALVENKGVTAIPTASDLATYMGVRNGLLVCPAGGIYSMGRVDQDPTCSIPGHSLNE
jgi:prepilin-type N-terminal cleavage/methylation domain-containing protein